MLKKLLFGITIAVLSSSMVSVLPAMAASIVNGSFECGLCGWNTVVRSNNPQGIVVVPPYDINGAYPNAPKSPTDGTHYAFINSQIDSRDSFVLYQDVSLESGFKHSLSFDWWFLDRGYAKTRPPESFFRVDVMSPQFNSWFGISTAGVEANVVDSHINTAIFGNPWTSTSYDLTPFAGQKVRLAFRAQSYDPGVDYNLYIPSGIDNVLITSTRVPTPAILPGVVLAGLFIGKRFLHRKSKPPTA